MPGADSVGPFRQLIPTWASSHHFEVKNMSNSSLKRRVNRLERQKPTADGSGLAPHSEKWISFWTNWLGQLRAGKPTTPRRITVEAFRAVLLK